MAIFTLFSLSLLFLITSTSSRTTPFQHHQTLSVSPTPFSNNNVVCDSARFTSLGLDISVFAYCNVSLPFDVRAKDLVDRMTLTEKVGQLGDLSYGVPRLGLPKYNWWSEALHGVSDFGRSAHFNESIVPGATSFPTVILTSASFNESLWKRIGQAVSTEARAMYNLGLSGLTFWSPNINIARDPRWGRILETPGEDPFVVGTYAVNYVRGLQDVEGHENPLDLNSRPLKVAACCKHYAAYDVDNWFNSWLNVDRNHFDANVTEQDMMESFLSPFEMCIKDGDVGSVMCSYNRVNGIPSCANPLLKQTIRDDWNLHGYIVSDCDSLEVIHKYHQWLGNTQEDTVSQAIKAGLDLDCGIYYTNFSENAVMQGKMRESDIDKSLRNLYVVLMRVGFFDGSPFFDSLGKDDICSTDHMNLAAEAATQGIVLLKNDNMTLPFSSEKIKTLALVGPHANATDVMVGNYAGIPCKFTSPLDAFNTIANVTYEPGCLDVSCKNETMIFKAMQASKKVDATIIFAGLDLSVEAESLDRTNLVLPGYQTQLINQIALVAKGPVILVLLTAGGLDIGFAASNPNITSIIWAGYPGQEGGTAIKDVIYGNYNPGGRLPVTWHEQDYVDQLPMTSMQLRPDNEKGFPGRTYKFFNGSSIYPFGYGISYSTFNYTLPISNRAIKLKIGQYQHCRDLTYAEGAYRPPCPGVLVDDTRCNEEFEFQVQVLNNGTMDANHVVMVYSKPPIDIVGTHLKKLIGFKRVSIPAGQNTSVQFKFNVCKSLSIVDYAANNVLPSGEHTIIVDNGVESSTFVVHLYLKREQQM